MDETTFAVLRQAVTDGEPALAQAAAREALAAGIPPLRLIDEAAMPALREVGEGFSNGDLFLPDLMLAARAMQAAMREIEPALKAGGEQRASAGRVVLGTVAGDIHEIGKNLVATLLSANGFEVYDLGVDVAPAAFAAKAAEVDASLVGVSALLTTTMTGTTRRRGGARRGRPPAPGEGDGRRRPRDACLGRGDRRRRVRGGRDRGRRHGPPARRRAGVSRVP